MKLDGRTATMRHKDNFVTNHTKVRECAAAILRNLQEGKDEKPKGFTPTHIGAAYRLLKFEGLISYKATYSLNSQGKNHIEKHGFVVYPA